MESTWFDSLLRLLGSLWALATPLPNPASGPNTVELTYRVVAPAGELAAARNASAAVLRQRLQSLGHGGARVAAAGVDRIVVVLPDDPAARRLLGRSGRLAFHEVDDDPDLCQRLGPLPDGARSESSDVAGDLRCEVVADEAETIHQLARRQSPAAHVWGIETRREEGAGAAPRERYVLRVLRAPPALGGKHIVEARVEMESHGPPCVTVSFDGAGAAAFEALTARLVGRRLAIVSDGAVLMAPRVMSRIAGGRIKISLAGHGLAQMLAEARELALVLSRPLPASLEMLSQVALRSR
jgi:preprotein translocase subunit SecD